MTKAQRERVRRHAAVVATGTLAPQQDADTECWSDLLRWRGQGDDQAEPQTQAVGEAPTARRIPKE